MDIPPGHCRFEYQVPEYQLPSLENVDCRCPCCSAQSGPCTQQEQSQLRRRMGRGVLHDCMQKRGIWWHMEWHMSSSVRLNWVLGWAERFCTLLCACLQGPAGGTAALWLTISASSTCGIRPRTAATCPKTTRTAAGSGSGCSATAAPTVGRSMSGKHGLWIGQRGPHSRVPCLHQRSCVLQLPSHLCQCTLGCGVARGQP